MSEIGRAMAYVVMRRDGADDDGERPLAVFLDRAEAEEFVTRTNALAETESKAYRAYGDKVNQLIEAALARNKSGEVERRSRRVVMAEALDEAGPMPERLHPRVSLEAVPLCTSAEISLRDPWVTPVAVRIVLNGEEQVVMEECLSDAVKHAAWNSSDSASYEPLAVETLDGKVLLDRAELAAAVEAWLENERRAIAAAG